METVMHILNSLSVIACLLIVGRLITFKKDGKRYRFFISLAVWVIINICVSIALWLIFAGFHSVLLAIVTTLFLYVFAIQLFICRGNFAALFYKNLIARQQ